MKNNKKTIIFLSGLRGSGKSTSAKFLVQECLFKEFSFADPLKQALSILLDTPIEWFYDPKLKECIIPFWGKSARYFMQKWGTEVFRDYIPKITPQVHSLWIQLMNKKIQESNEQYIVISDCRFNNEIIDIKNDNCDNVYITINIVGINRIVNIDLSENISEHSSEIGISKDLIDYEIENNDTIEKLFLKLKRIIIL